MKISILTGILACLLWSCHNSTNPQANTSADSLDQANTSVENAIPPPPEAKGFDMNSIPISKVALGPFPYFSLPEGYESRNKNKPKDYDHFPFWVGDHFQWIEGKIFYNDVSAKDGKEFSRFEVMKNLDNLIRQAGGVKIFEGKIPSDSSSALADRPDDITVDYVDGIGDIYNDPATVYVIHRKEKDIWIHLCISSLEGGWVIAETKPFEQTATLIPVEELKKQIESSGKAIIYVNFATDHADILPESQPQIDQVLALLQQDKELKLSVNGYTDNSGAVQHNQTLSEARAQAVVRALTGKGIDQGRLQSKGFGQDNPVADNSTEAGKAQNRRVELVKL